MTPLTLHARRHRLVLVALVGLFSCSPRATPEATPEATVESWSKLAPYLPSQGDVRMIQSRLPIWMSALRAGLSDKHNHVRLCMAYVVEHLAEKGQGLAEDVRRAFFSERDPLVRAYLASALGAIGGRSQENVLFLRETFDKELQNLARIYLAGALVRLGTPKKEPEAWQYIVSSLKPVQPEGIAGETETEEHWDTRCAAADVLSRIGPNAEPALPSLELLLGHPETPQWAKRHIRAAIESIRKAEQ